MQVPCSSTSTARVQGCMPGSAVLGGWPAMAYGQMGVGPKPASLNVLETLGVDMEAITNMIDELFRLDSASPPMLWRHGHMRPMVHAAFASMIMYFDERSQAGEVLSVLAKMCSLLPLNLVESDAPSTFSKWGNAIRAQFALDNLELTSKATDPGIGQLVATVQSLGQTVGGMHAQLASMQREFALLRSAPTSPAAASPRRRSTPPSSAPSPLRAQPVATNDEEPPPPPPPQQPPRPAFGSLLPSSGQKATSLTGVRAADFYEECMAKGGVVPHFEHKQQKPKAEICIKWFNSMATDEEKAVLKPPKPAAPGEPNPGPIRASAGPSAPSSAHSWCSCSWTRTRPRTSMCREGS